MHLVSNFTCLTATYVYISCTCEERQFTISPGKTFCQYESARIIFSLKPQLRVFLDTLLHKITRSNLIQINIIAVVYAKKLELINKNESDK